MDYEKKMREQEEGEGEDDEEDEEFTVETVLERKVKKNGKVEYHIKWQGYDDKW